MDRRKYLGRAWGGDYFKSFTSKVIRVDETGYSGYASLIQIEEVNRPYIVGENTCIADNGYSAITFLPDNKFWAVDAIYDNNNDIVEWYFDITKENAIDDDGKPYFNDLYLDAALLPDGLILVFDEDELKDALDEAIITQKEYEMAYEVLRELQENKTLDVAYMTKLFAELRVLF